jgi:hypothetical protein
MITLPTCLYRSEGQDDIYAIVGSRNPQLGVYSTSGLVIENLPGVTVNDVYSISDSDYVNAKEFFRDKVKFALHQVAVELVNWTLPKFRLEAVLDRPLVGKIKKGSAEYFGLTSDPTARGIKCERYYSDDYGVLFIESVVVYSDTDGTNTLTITDNTGQSMAYSFTAVAGTGVRVLTDFQSAGTQVMITTDASLINQRKTDVNTVCGSCGIYSGKQWKITGWDGSKEDKSTYGLSAQMVYKCDQYQMMCMFTQTPVFPQAVLYQLGYEISNEWLRPERTNPKTMTRERMLELRDYIESKRDQALENLRETTTAMMARPRSGCISSNSTRFTQTSNRVFNSWR